MTEVEYLEMQERLIKNKLKIVRLAQKCVSLEASFVINNEDTGILRILDLWKAGYINKEHLDEAIESTIKRFEDCKGIKLEVEEKGLRISFEQWEQPLCDKE